eukprot:1270268-Prorocentrum_lima.AAC.1
MTSSLVGSEMCIRDRPILPGWLRASTLAAIPGLSWLALPGLHRTSEKAQLPGWDPDHDPSARLAAVGKPAGEAGCDKAP